MIKAVLFSMPDTMSRFDVLIRTPNLGIVSLAGNVDPSVCDVKTIDLVPIKKNLDEHIKSLLKEHSPDLVGLSFMSFQYLSAIRIAKLVKEHDKNIRIVLGGYHPTLMFEEMAELPEYQNIDFIIRGEGEATFRELTEAMNSGTGFEKIASLSYKDNRGFHHNPSRELLDLDSIQLPNRSARLLTKGFYAYNFPLDAVETSRGCTNKCKFCSISKMYGRNYRTYQIDRVIADIRDAQKHGAKAIFLVDDNITLDIRRFETLCEEIISAKLNSIHYLIQASVRGMAHSERVVQKMADAGIKSVFMGIESVSQDNLDFLQKQSTTSEETIRAVKYLKDNNVLISGGLIIGLPDDDEKSLWNTYKMAKELKLDFPIFFILMPHLKTELRDELIEQGLVVNVNEYHKHHGFAANVRTKYLSAEDIERIANKMYFSYYSDIRYLFTNQMRKTFPFFFWRKALEQIPGVIKDAININMKRNPLKHNQV